MLKLIGYEFRKSWFFKAIALGITALLELLYVVGLLTRDEGTIMTGAVLLAVTASVCITGIGIISVVVLHRDMNTRQGYMLFMTPNSTYRILGAKVLENGLSILLVSVCFGLLGFLDISLLFSHYGELDRLWEIFSQVTKNMAPWLELNWQTLTAFLVNILCSWLAMVNMGYLADVLASSVLRGRKAGGFVAFLIFIAMSFAMSWLQNVLLPNTMAIIPHLVWDSVIALVCAAGMYFLTAWVMDRKLSV